MKNLFIILFIFQVCFQLEAQDKYYLIVKVVEKDSALSKVKISAGPGLDFKTKDDGIAKLKLKEGRSSLLMSHKDYISQWADIVVSRIEADNYYKLELKRVETLQPTGTAAASGSKVIDTIFVTGFVLADKENFPVKDVMVKLFFDDKELKDTTGTDGSFSFKIPDDDIRSYNWTIQYFHAQYNYYDLVKFDVPKSNVVQFKSLITLKDPEVETTTYKADFIIRPYVWNKNDWRVDDISECDCITQINGGFRLNLTGEPEEVRVKLVRRGFEDKDLIITSEEIKNTKLATYVDMNEASRSGSRLNFSASYRYHLNNKYFSSPGFLDYAVIYHPHLPKSLNNRIGIILGFIGNRELEVTNSYKTLGAIEGSVTSRYNFINQWYTGLRFYWKDYMKNTHNYFIEPQVTFATQKPKGLFQAENAVATLKSTDIITPSLRLGYRRNLLSFLSLEGSVGASYLKVKGESFIFNYFGSADPTETSTQFFKLDIRGAITLFVPNK